MVIVKRTKPSKAEVTELLRTLLGHELRERARRRELHPLRVLVTDLRRRTPKPA